MTALAYNIADYRRRRGTRRRAMGDLFDDSGTGSNQGIPTGDAGGWAGDLIASDTVSVQELRNENSQGDFNNLQTPFPYYGNVGSVLDPYGNNVAYIAGVDGGPAFTIYTPTSDPSLTSGGIQARTGVVSSTTTPSTTAATSTGVLATAVSIFSTPLYSGSSITWGWVLIGAAALWLLLRER